MYGSDGRRACTGPHAGVRQTMLTVVRGGWGSGKHTAEKRELISVTHRHALLYRYTANFGYNDVPLGKKKGRYMRSVTISEVHISWHCRYMYVWMQNFVYVLHA